VGLTKLMADQEKRITLPPLAASPKSNTSSATEEKATGPSKSDNGATAEAKEGPVSGVDFPAHLFPYPEGTADVTLARVLNIAQLTKALAACIKDASAEAIEKRGAFTVVLSGGSLIRVSSTQDCR
jgi:hypothetical protein